MGRQFSYTYCPRSPTERMPDQIPSPKSKTWAIGFGISFAVVLVLFFIFLGLYLMEHEGDPSVRLRECESQLRNQTSITEVRLADQREQAKAESEALQTQLAAANQNLKETRGQWASCQEDLKLKEKNTSMMADAIHKMEDKLKHLEGEKTRLQQQQAAYELERNQSEKTIRHLKEQLSTRWTSSGGVVFSSSMASFLLLIVPGLLYGLL